MDDLATKCCAASEQEAHDALRRRILAPSYRSVIDSFLDVACGRHDAVAVVQGRTAWTYAETSARAAAAARVLAAMVPPRSVVAVHGRRSPALVSSALGVLLGGNVVLLLDSALPLARKRLMLEESVAAVVLDLGGDESQAALRRVARCTVVPVDRDGVLAVPAVGSKAARREPPHAAGPGYADAAYVFFTSGTTGTPRGIVGSRRGLDQFIAWQRTEFAVGPHDRVSQLTSPSFDVVLRELFLPLTTGATLCIPDGSLRLTSVEVLKWLAEERVTVLHTVPTLARRWLAGTPPKLLDLRYVFFAGEPLDGNVLARWRDAVGRGAELVNLYGPTETTLAKCFYRIPDPPGAGIQPVGMPIPHCELYVADERGGLRRDGDGEIVLRTPFRTLGYVNAERGGASGFVPNGFRNDPDDLLYRTGDLGSVTRDRVVTIRGRVDGQVKINGVRIEPAEVAAVLSANPGVKDCAVIAVEHDAGGGDISLVAYWVPQPWSSATSASLKNAARERLPKEMIPRQFFAVRELPVTFNGKLDTTRLTALRREENAGAESNARPKP